MTLRVNQDEKGLAFSKTNDNHQSRRDTKFSSRLSRPLTQIVAPYYRVVVFKPAVRG
jgi:hypothetical protein